jgi:NADH:ubiquinone oxidoreductase subunit 4 (subunit M)
MIIFLLALIFSAFLILSFSLNHREGEKYQHFISLITIAILCSLLNNKYSLIAAFCLAPLSFLCLERKNKNLFFFKLSAISSILFAIVAFLVDQAGYYTFSSVFFILAIAIRQGIFPSHLWLLEVKNSPRLFPSFVFFLLCQTGAILYSLPLLHEHLPTSAIKFVGSFAIVSGIYLAVRAKLSSYHLEKHLLVIASQSSLLLTGLSHAYQLTTLGTVMYAIILAISGSIFAMIAYEIYRQKNIEKIDQYFSIYRTNKSLTFIYLICGMSLIGLPLTAGYFAEDLLFHGLIQNSHFDSLLFISMMAINGHTIYQIFCRLFFGHVSHRWLPLYHTKTNRFLITCTVFLLIIASIFVSPLTKKIETEIFGQVASITVEDHLE